MKCSHCGAEITEGTGACDACKSRLETDDAAQADTQEPAPRLRFIGEDEEKPAPAPEPLDVGEPWLQTLDSELAQQLTPARAKVIIAVAVGVTLLFLLIAWHPWQRPPATPSPYGFPIPGLKQDPVVMPATTPVRDAGTAPETATERTPGAGRDAGAARNTPATQDTGAGRNTGTSWSPGVR